MTDFKISHTLTINNIFFFIFYFVKVFPFILYNFNLLNILYLFNKQIKLFKIIKKHKIIDLNQFSIVNQNINKYLNMWDFNKSKDISTIEIEEILTIKSFVFTNKINTIKNNLLNVFFFLNYSYFNHQFTYNHHYKLFYIKHSKKKTIVFDLIGVFARWVDAYNLLFNIFYYKLNPLIFSSPFHKNEVLALNWNYSFFDINLWRYYFPFFTFKVNKHGTKVDFFFETLSSLNINFFIVSDCHYHFKNLYYMKRKNFYTLGLIDVDTNPWIVTYPIMSFFQSVLNQTFFLKLLIFIEKQNFLIKYLLFKKIWINNSIKNSILMYL